MIHLMSLAVALRTCWIVPNPKLAFHEIKLSLILLGRKKEARAMLSKCPIAAVKGC
jgi:hypothetical protein